MPQSNFGAGLLAVTALAATALPASAGLQGRAARHSRQERGLGPLTVDPAAHSACTSPVARG